MSKQIKYLSLQKTELEYEVEIRGEVPADNVQDLRKQIIKQIKTLPSEDILESHLDTAVDIKGAKDSLLKLKNNIQSLKTKYDKNLYSRTENLAHHIYHRLNRIQPVTSDDASNFKDCLQKLQVFYKDLASFFAATPTKTSIESEDIPVPSVSVTCDRGIAAELARLRFDGKSCVRAFIQEVEERIKARDIKPNRVLAFATEIFTGDALHWFRSIRDSIDNWDQLAGCLKRDFTKFDYDYRLMNEIRLRTQGESESIIVYLAIMEGLFSRLSKVFSDEEKLEILLHNIRPCYANTLACSPQIKTISDLRTTCRNYENYQARVSQFREPPKITLDTLAPEFAYTRPTTGPSSSKHYNTNEISTTPVDAVQQNTRASKPVYCPRCRCHTHSLKYCKEPRVIICFKCGKKDFRYPDCPNCNGSIRESVSKN
ncbi:unnamed protein product [Arctia plantaginis]|uniref:Retrotransposon gag domain-containing protein n=1 Tax=Arctia plantaginis TaxID=874455 RepID=A0A8S1AGN1_ARCPL|nr:unnamed protein product [Arctia plantaginis]CAB3260254.1 unnamed protein product [Arctia plantaginis]